jgi:hypothetical protein
MKNFFLSLKTTVWTLLLLVCVFFLGTYMMFAYPDVFSRMNEDILIQWVGETASANIWQTSWFFISIAGLLILTVNTLVCSIQAIRGKWSRSDFLVRISPQVVHIAFLFILLAHLLSTIAGYKASGVMPEGGFARLPEGQGLYLQKIDVQASGGYMQGWSAAVSVYENNRVVKSGILGPNQPLFYKGIGIYLKSLNYDRGPAALLLIAKDPGAVWALVGGILFILGTVPLLILKWKKA